ncbi:c-type cytochrome [Spirosoma fluminis]
MGLIVLVSLSVVLLVTSAFLYQDDAPTGPQGKGTGATPPTSVSKPVQLTEEQVYGKTLFINNCAHCHAATNEVVFSPGLAGVEIRTPGEAWLIKWICNSQAVVESGDPYAVQVFNQFNKIPMSSFPNLTNADIKAILSYTQTASVNVPAAEGDTKRDKRLGFRAGTSWFTDLTRRLLTKTDSLVYRRRPGCLSLSRAYSSSPWSTCP